MPLTFDDREDLYIEIELLRKRVKSLTEERDEALRNLQILEAKCCSLYGLFFFFKGE